MVSSNCILSLLFCNYRNVKEFKLLTWVSLVLAGGFKASQYLKRQ